MRAAVVASLGRLFCTHCTGCPRRRPGEEGKIVFHSNRAIS